MIISRKLRDLRDIVDTKMSCHVNAGPGGCIHCVLLAALPEPEEVARLERNKEAARQDYGRLRDAWENKCPEHAETIRRLHDAITTAGNRPLSVGSDLMAYMGHAAKGLAELGQQRDELTAALREVDQKRHKEAARFLMRIRNLGEQRGELADLVRRILKGEPRDTWWIEAGELTDIDFESVERDECPECDPLRESLERCLTAMQKFDHTDYDDYGGPHLSVGIENLGKQRDEMAAIVEASKNPYLRTLSQIQRGDPETPYETVKQQRDELAAALRDAQELIGRRFNPSIDKDAGRVYWKINAALTRVEES